MRKGGQRVDKIATLSSEERSDIFAETADKMGLHPGIIEKDFWVCWALRHLFALPEIGEHIIFKGGTTLSKIYGVIERFSEDIDISISRELLGFVGDKDPANPELSGKKRDRLLGEMSATCGEYVQGPFGTKLHETFSGILTASNASWDIQEDKNDSDHLTLLFHYPSSESNPDYITPHVRIESGCRSEFWPTAAAEMKPYCAEHIPNVFEEPSCSVTVLTAERTFWEKATILHQEYHRPKERPVPLRHARHYYDLFKLAATPHKDAALGDLELLKHVVSHKKTFFRCGWAKYDEAVPGTFRMAPSGERRAEVESDYRAMEVMFFGEIPPFGGIVTGLEELEAEVNGLQWEAGHGG